MADRPKPMAEVAGRPFLEWLLLSFRDWGITDVLLCVGYRAECIRRHFGEGASLGLRILYSEEGEPMGTGGALRHALPLLSSDPVLVANGDSYCEAPLDRFLALHRQRRADGSLLLVRARDPGRYGAVELDAEGSVVGFDEKTDRPDGAWINAGLYLFTRALIATIPLRRPVSLEREMMPQWLPRRLVGCAGDWRFLDIGTPDSYRHAAASLAGSRLAGLASCVEEERA